MRTVPEFLINPRWLPRPAPRSSGGKILVNTPALLIQQNATGVTGEAEWGG